MNKFTIFIYGIFAYTVALIAQVWFIHSSKNISPKLEHRR
jgi:hypothetical protein